MKLNRLNPILSLSILLCSFVSSSARGQSQDAIPNSNTQSPMPGADSASEIGAMKVIDTHIEEFDPSHLRIAVDVDMTPAKSVTLENLRLSALRLNGLPIYADALAQPIELAKGKTTALPPIHVTILFRDLDTAAPLREMIDKQNAHLQGNIVADIKMSFMDKLAIHTQHPRVSVPFAADVPVTIGSSPLERRAVLGLLTVAEMGMHGGAAIRRNLPGSQSDWTHDLAAQANANLLDVQTSYQLKEHDTSYPVVSDQLGFRLSSGQIITTAEAKTPWEYDAEFQSRIKSGEAKLVKNSTEISLYTTGSPNPQDAPPSLLKKDFTIESRGSADKDSLIVPVSDKDHYSKITVRRRASPGSLSIILLQAPVPGGFTSAPLATLQQDHWDDVAIFRLNREIGSANPTVEVVGITAAKEGQTIRFSHPVDPSFYGSPVLTPEGVIGFVQDENAGTFLPSDLALQNSAKDAAVATETGGHP